MELIIRQVVLKSIPTKWRLLLLVVLLQLITVGVLGGVDRFRVVKQQLLKDPGFDQMSSFWTQKGNGLIVNEGEAISIVNREKVSHTIFQTFSVEEAGHYDVSFDVSTKDVVLASKDRGGASVFLIFREDSGDFSGMGKRLYAATGDLEMASYGRTIYLGKNIGSLDFAVRLNQASGELTLSNPVVSLLQENSFYKKLKVALIMLWCLIFVWFTIAAMRYLGRPQVVALGVVLGIALVCVLLPESVMNSFYVQIASVLPESIIDSFGGALTYIFGYTHLANNSAVIGKIGHFAAFLFLGVIAGVNFIRLGVWFSLSMLTVLAFFTEALQLIVVGRTPLVNDFIVDMVAAFIGVLLGAFVYRCLTVSQRMPE